jgi:hypothetical protein
VVAQYSQIGALFLPHSQISLRIYAQQPDDTIQEYGYEVSEGWTTMVNFGKALHGSPLATTAYQNGFR